MKSRGSLLLLEYKLHTLPMVYNMAFSKYSRTLMAQRPLEPSKYVRDMGSLS